MELTVEITKPEFKLSGDGNTMAIGLYHHWNRAHLQIGEVTVAFLHTEKFDPKGETYGALYLVFGENVDDPVRFQNVSIGGKDAGEALLMALAKQYGYSLSERERTP